jgi:hypothetical protein
MTLTPANGRDYKSKKAVLEDLLVGKDFIVASVDSPYMGKPANRQSLLEFGVRMVSVRYNGLRRQVIVNLSTCRART